jgi:hypothetical protein
MEMGRLADMPDLTYGLGQLVFYLPDAAAWELIMTRLAAAGVGPHIDYWQATALLPTKTPGEREVVLAPWAYGPP